MRGTRYESWLPSNGYKPAPLTASRLANDSAFFVTKPYGLVSRLGIRTSDDFLSKSSNMSLRAPRYSPALESLYHSFLQGCRENPTGRCVQVRGKASVVIESSASNGWLTYEALGVLAERLISFLQSELPQLAPGTRIALYSRFNWEAVVVLLAASFLRLPTLLLDVHEQPSTVSVQLRKHQVQVLFLGREQYRTELQAAVSQCLFLGEEAADSPSETRALAAVLRAEASKRPVNVTASSGHETAVIATTSGVTGSPRVVALSQKRLAEAAEDLAPLLMYSVTDVACFLTESLFHPFFIVHMLLLFQAGAAFGAELSTLDNIRKMNTTVIVGPGATLSCFYELLCKEGEKLHGLARRIFALLVDRPPLNEWDSRSPRKSNRSGLGRTVMRNIRDFFLPRYRLTVSGISRLAEDTRICLERVLLEPVVDIYGPMESAGVVLARTRKRERNEWLPVLNVPFHEVGRLTTLVQQDETAAYGELHLRIDGAWVATGDLFRFIQEQGKEEENPRIHLLGMVDRISNIVLCAENGARELDADRPEPIQLGLEDSSPPFLSLALMERACRRSAFIRQSWISFQSPRALMVFLVPVRQMVRDWQRVRIASRGHAPHQPTEKLDTETIRLVCNDALFQEAVVCDMRRVLLRCQAIREDWFDALSWEIYFEPQLDETYFDLGFTPRNGLLSPAFDLKRGALYFHYAKELGIPVPRASLERGTLLAEEMDTDELAEELDTDEYEPDSGAEADASGASGLQRWLLALWSTLRADLVDPLLNDDEAVQRPLWQRLFYRHAHTGNSAKLVTGRGTAEDAPRTEDATTSAASPQAAEALPPSPGQSPPQENRWIMRLLRPAWDPNRADSALFSRDPAQCKAESGTDPTCMPPLLSTRDSARRGRSRRTRNMHQKAYHEHDLPRWRFARFWNTLIPESPLEKFTPSADPDDVLTRDPLSLETSAGAETSTSRWRRWLRVVPPTESSISSSQHSAAHGMTVRKEHSIHWRHRQSADALSMSDSEMNQRRQRRRRRAAVRIQAVTASRFWRWWTNRELDERPPEEAADRAAQSEQVPTTSGQAAQQGPQRPLSPSSGCSVDSLSNTYQRSVHIGRLP